MTHRGGLTRFARVLLTMGSGESPWLILAFLLGIIALGVLSNLTYELLTDVGALSLPEIMLTCIAVIILIGVAFLAYRIDLQLGWRPVRISAAFSERRAPRHAGLIWLLSLGNLELSLITIRHHISGSDGEALRYCWVLLTPAVRDTGMFRQLQERMDELDCNVRLFPIDLRSETAEETYRAVIEVYEQQAKMPDINLSPNQIISDITGGNKPMSAGVVMACLPHDWPLEYVASQRDPVTGNYEAKTQQVVLVKVDFDVNA